MLRWLLMSLMLTPSYPGEFCGRGYIVEARLKHHKKTCEVSKHSLFAPQDFLDFPLPRPAPAPPPTPAGFVARPSPARACWPSMCLFMHSCDTTRQIYKQQQLIWFSLIQYWVRCRLWDVKISLTLNFGLLQLNNSKSLADPAHQGDALQTRLYVIAYLRVIFREIC